MVRGMPSDRDTVADYQAKAAQCRRAAAASADPEDVRWLLLRGFEFDLKAAHASRLATPSG
jgi:hypothetical protein